MIIYNNCGTALCRLSAAPRRVPFQKSRSTGFHAGLHNALQIRAVRNRLVKETRGNFAAIYEKRPGHSQRVPARNPWSVPREDRPRSQTLGLNSSFTPARFNPNSS